MADGRHPTIRRIAARFGVTSSDFAWRPIASRRHLRKLERDASYRRWIEARGNLADHWGHETVSDEFARLHLGSQLYELCRTLKERVGRVDGLRVLDAGASDGLFLNELGAVNGVGVNFLQACARKIAADRQIGCVADVERLPFADRTFDIVLCCETLEHVPNPVGALNELARVCRGRLFVTIPWLARTRINTRPEGWPEVESHIFEFSEADFARVVSHAAVRVTYRNQIDVFPEPSGALMRWWLVQWMYPHYFPKLQYYELTPVHR